jgi:hypothetical protein
MDLEGKTIARVVDLDYDGQALIFTDGTAAHFQWLNWQRVHVSPMRRSGMLGISTSQSPTPPAPRND